MRRIALIPAVSFAAWLFFPGAALGGEANEPRLTVHSDTPAWFQWSDGSPFFLCGPGDPEDFLYRGEEGPGGVRRGDQMEIIRKLAGTGANCIYLMAVRSHGGDGDATHNPFLEHDPAQGLNPRVLDQWDEWFEEMDKHGIVIYFIVYDDSAAVWNPKGSPGEGTVRAGEEAFLRALVNRFEHHRHLVWCVAEEYSEKLTKGRAGAIAQVIRDADDYDHPIAVHQLTGTEFDFPDHPAIDQFAIQLGVGGGEALPLAEINRSVRDAWNSAEGRYNLNMSEMGGHFGAEDRAITRKRTWAAAMGGAYAMVIGMDVAATPVEYLRDCGRLNEFFTATRFAETRPRNDLALGAAEYALAAPGRSYILYASNAESGMGIKDLPKGTYRLRWFDIEEGRWSAREKVESSNGNRIFDLPEGMGGETALYVVRADLANE